LRPYFFKPGQLGAQTANLGVQWREVLQGLVRPAVHLMRMDPAFRGNLGNALAFAEYFQDNLGFLIGCEVRFLGYSFS
jgi:hypothetical protein